MLLNKKNILENFMDDKELLFESIDLFLERVCVRLDILSKAVNELDAPVIMAEAHAIKGMVGIFSIGEIYQLANQLENKARIQELKEIKDQYEHFNEELQKFMSELKAWREEE